MERYTLGDQAGRTMRVMLRSHRQHIWDESYIRVSRRVARRIQNTLGSQPYTNPRGNFGEAMRVYVES